MAGEFRFKTIAHPGSLMTLGQPINGVTVLVRFIDINSEKPSNLNTRCPSFKSTITYNINIVYNELRTCHRVYDLAKEVCDALRGKKPLIFCTGIPDTQLYSWVSGLAFDEISSDSNACYSYSFDLEVCYMETYRTCYALTQP